MITLFNRKELAITFSMKEQADIRELLSNHKIDYKIDVANDNNFLGLNNTRSRTGTFGENMDLSCKYTFYVHKKDLEIATAIINGNLKR